MRLTLANKLRLLTGALLVVFMIFGFFCIFQNLIINKDIKEIAEVKEPISASAYEMEINLIGTGFAVLGYLHDHDSKHLERIKKDKQDFENFQKKYRKLAATEKDKGLADRVDKGYAEFIGLALELIRNEDEQSGKMSLFSLNLRKIDDILDDNIQASVKPDSPDAVRKIKSSYEMEINAYEIAAGMSNYLRSHSEIDEAKLHKDEKHFRKHLEEYKDMKLSSEEQRWAAQISRLFDENIAFVKDIIELGKTKEKDLARLVQIRRELDMVLDEEIQTLTHANLDEAKADALNALKTSNIFIIIGIFLTVVIGAAGSLIIIRSITKPVRRLVDATAEISKGNFSFKASVESDDEIGTLADSFNLMTEELQKTMISRDYIKDIIQSISDGLIVVSPEGRIETANPAASALLGYGKEGLCGEMYDEIFPKETGASALIDSALNKGIAQTTEKTCLLKDGRKMNALFSTSVMRNGSGVVCAIKDMTEIKQAETAVIESEAKLRTIIESSMDAVIAIDEKGNITLFNPAAEELFMYSAQELLNEPLKILLREDAAESHQKKIENFLSKGSGQCGHIGRRMERVFRRKDGALFTAEVAMAGARLENKRLVVVSIHDVTERKKAEDALRESEEKYRSLFEDSKDMVYISTPEGKFLDINSAGVELFGYDTKEELLGLDIEKDIYLSPFDRKKFIETVEKQGFVKDYELLMKKKNGETLNLLSTTVSHKNKEGKITEYRGIMHDITHQKKLEQQLLQSQKMEAVGQLAGGIAHDFNNILTAIIGYASVMQMKMPNDDPLRDYLEHVLASSDRAADLTQKLLMFSRKQASNPELVSLNETISRVEKILSRVIGEDIELKITLSDNDLTVMADSGEIEQALMNLAVNARDAMPNGGELTIETKQIELDIESSKAFGFGKAGAYACIAVSDTGAGIDPSVREKIFEPFFTTKESGKGTGLGLSIVYGIVKQHNGYINCYSEKNRGTTFKIYLPLFKTKPVSKTAAEKMPVSMPKGGTETILVAEDEVSVREFIKGALEESGYRVIEASDGEDAVSKFTANKDRIDLLLFDIIMPKKRGTEAYKKIRKIKPKVKVLFISGYTSDSLKTDKLPEKDLFVLSKPFRPDELLMKIREILDK